MNSAIFLGQVCRTNFLPPSKLLLGIQIKRLNWGNNGLSLLFFGSISAIHWSNKSLWLKYHKSCTMLKRPDTPIYCFASRTLCCETFSNPLWLQDQLIRLFYHKYPRLLPKHEISCNIFTIKIFLKVQKLLCMDNLITW